MKKIAIVLDSTTLPSEKLKNHPDVYVAPLEVIADGKTYRDGVDLVEEDWVRFLKEDVTMTTSQPSLKNTIDVLKEVKSKNYEHIFVLPLTSNLSGTYNSFVLANNELQVENLEIIDTLSIAGQLTIIAEKIFEWNEEGKSIDEIREMILKLADHNVTYIYPATLKRLILSGRMNKAVGSFANLLKLRLLLVFENKGKQIERHDIYRTEKKLYSEMMEQLRKTGVEPEKWMIYVLSVENPEGVEKLSNMLREEFGDIEIREETLPGVISTHVGIGVLGVQAQLKEV